MSMKRTVVHRLGSVLLGCVMLIGFHSSFADTDQPAALALTARVSLKTIETVLRSSINGGQPIEGRENAEHRSKLGAYGLVYRVNVSALTITSDEGDLLVTVPIRLMPISGKRSLIWINSPVSRVFTPVGCGSTTVKVVTRVKLAVDNGKLSASAHADRATIANACRIGTQPKLKFVLEQLRRNRDLSRGIDALLSWPVHQSIRDAVGVQVGGAIRAQLSSAVLARLVTGFQARAIAQFSQPIPLPLASTELALHIGNELELLDVAVQETYLRIGTRVMVSPQLVFDGVTDTVHSSLGSAHGFRFPLDLVLPLTPFAEGDGLEELTIDIPNGDERLGIARVPGHADLIRVRKMNHSGAAKMMYFAARPPVDSSAAVSGSFSELLGEASIWLADTKRWPASARRDTARLSRQVQVFRRALLAALAGLGRIELRPGVTFALSEPTIVLGDGRVSDKQIRIPAVLSGFAEVSLTVE